MCRCAYAYDIHMCTDLNRWVCVCVCVCVCLCIHTCILYEHTVSLCISQECALMSVCSWECVCSHECSHARVCVSVCECVCLSVCVCPRNTRGLTFSLPQVDMDCMWFTYTASVFCASVFACCV